MLVISALIFGLVLAMLLIGVLRRRGAEEPPPVGAGRRIVVWGGVVMPGLVLLALFVLTLRALPETAPASSGGDPEIVVDVTGHQYFWDVEYEGEPRVRTANEMHVPVGETVRLRVRTDDVLHSLWIPDLNRKIDLVPGQTNVLDLSADEPGEYEGRCAEFCGLGHTWMGFTVYADRPPEFRQWLAAQARPAEPPGDAEARRGQQVVLGSACVYCHTISGTNASGRIGPDLTHVASRSTLGARVIPNLPGYLAGWIVDPQHFKPGNRMPGSDMSGPDLQAVVSYLTGLR